MIAKLATRKAKPNGQLYVTKEKVLPPLILFLGFFHSFIDFLPFLYFLDASFFPSLFVSFPPLSSLVLIMQRWNHSCREYLCSTFQALERLSPRNLPLLGSNQLVNYLFYLLYAILFFFFFYFIFVIAITLLFIVLVRRI